VNDEQIRQLTADDNSEWEKNPMETQVGHRVLPLIEPLIRELLHTGDEVEYDELELDEKIIPEWYLSVGFIAPRVDGAVGRGNRISFAEEPRELSHSPVVMSVSEQEDETNQSIQVAVVVPRSLVQQKNVPVSRHEHDARSFELVAERDAQSSCKLS
jgi:hypothetical protein